MSNKGPASSSRVSSSLALVFDALHADSRCSPMDGRLLGLIIGGHDLNHQYKHCKVMQPTALYFAYASAWELTESTRCCETRPVGPQFSASLAAEAYDT